MDVAVANDINTEQASIRVNGIKILIAEDDTVTRRVLEASLLYYGFRVVSTCNGAEAFEALHADEPPQLIILDLSMPMMSGLELCKWIRSNERLRHSYVILLSSRSEPNDVVDGLRAGADDYIAKPYNREELRARIQVGLRVLALQRELATRRCPNCGYSEEALA